MMNQNRDNGGPFGAPADVFLSYATVDRDFVEKVRLDLEKSNYTTTWMMDDQKIQGGSQGEYGIDMTLQRCKVFIVIITEASNKSRWVQREIIRAEQQQKCCIPLLLNDEMPLRLLDLEFVDFRMSYDDGIVSLLNVLATRKALLDHEEKLKQQKDEHDDTEAQSNNDEITASYVEQRQQVKPQQQQQPLLSSPSSSSFFLGNIDQFFTKLWRKKNGAKGGTGQQKAYKVHMPYWTKQKSTNKTTAIRRPLTTEGPGSISSDGKSNGDSVIDDEDGATVTAKPVPTSTATTTTASNNMMEAILMCIPHGRIEGTIASVAEMEQDIEFLNTARLQLCKEITAWEDTEESIKRENVQKVYADFLESALEYVTIESGRNCSYGIKIVNETIALKIRIDDDRNIGPFSFTPGACNDKTQIDSVNDDECLRYLLEGIMDLQTDLMKHVTQSYVGSTWLGSSVCILLRAPEVVIDTLYQQWKSSTSNFELALGNGMKIVDIMATFTVSAKSPTTPRSLELDDSKNYPTVEHINDDDGIGDINKDSSIGQSVFRLCDSIEFLVANTIKDSSLSSSSSHPPLHFGIAALTLDDNNSACTFLIPSSNDVMKDFLQVGEGSTCWYPMVDIIGETEAAREASTTARQDAVTDYQDEIGQTREELVGKLAEPFSRDTASVGTVLSDPPPPSPHPPTTGDVATIQSTPSPVHMQMVMSKLKPLKDDVLSYVASPDSISRKSLSLLVNDSATGRPFSDFYDMNDVIGEGGYALVYSCQHKKNAKDYAVKEVIDENYEADGENLKEEIDALKRLREGPYVVRLFDVFREEDRTYVVMEEMKGGDLLERLTEKDHFSEKESRKISRTLLEAIGFCHRKKIVHRDIKPENILLADKNDDTTIKLADFGCARNMDDEFVEECKLTTLCGSPQYVAPELYTHEDGYDERCDLWSAGVVIFVLLGGYAPFEAPTNELPEMITDGYFEFHPKYWIDISQPPKDLIESLLEVNPDDRASIDEALDSEWLRRRDKEFMDESNGDFNDWLKRTSDINLNSISKLNLSFSDSHKGSDSYKEMLADLSESVEETQQNDNDSDSSDSAKESNKDKEEES